MGPVTDEPFFLRNYLTDTPKNANPKSVAFSPDIIPSFGNIVPVSSLISTYSSFVALPVIPFDVNNVYVRGLVLNSSGSAVFNMVAVPSEMILWPQVWNKSQPLAPGPIVVPTAQKSEYVGAAAPFTVRPSDLGGVNYALIAIQSPPPDGSEGNIRFKDALAPFPRDIANWRDYYDWISTDKSTTFYNTVVADPTSPVISITTRLRLFEDEPSITSIDIMLLFEHVGLDPETEVSIVSDAGNISLGRTKLGPETGTVGVHLSLPANFDGLVTFNIFPTAVPISDMSWLALQVSTLKGSDGGIDTQCILGAQNVVFASDATRNARFLSPAALQATVSDKKLSVTFADPAQKPATGWWFRDNISDQNLYPRVGAMYYSPDIQVMGTTPDANVVADLSGANANVDITDKNAKEVVGGAPNYVNLRGNCTLGQYAVDTRLFLIPCNVLITPSQYGQNSVVDYDTHGDPTGPAIRSITTVNAGDFNVVGNAFNILDPPSPESLGSSHYCLIAETRHPTQITPDPQWPHEQTGDFATGDDLNAWVAGNPNVAWRNIGYTTDGGGATRIFPSTMTIPADKYGPTTTWLLTVNGYNVPIGSSWALTASGDPIPGVNINFAKTDITANNATEGVHFTGLPSEGYDASLTLQWWSNGKPAVVGDGTGMRFTYALINVAANALAASYRLGGPLPEASIKWPLYVGICHPGLKKNANIKGFRALVPQFEAYGRQPSGLSTNQSQHLGAERVPRVGVVPSNGICLGGDTFVVRQN